MRTLLRLRINDSSSDPRWTDTQIDTELNSAAKMVSREISKQQRLNYFAATEDITTSGTTKAYALVATDIRRIYKMTRYTSVYEEPCRQIDERDKLDNSTPVRDELGNWIYFVTRSAATGLFSINFPQSISSGLVFRVQYIQRLTEITAGGSGSQTFPAIDEDYHEMIVQRAVIQLLGPDGAGLQAAVQYYGELKGLMMEDLDATSDGDTIQDDFERP